MNISKANVLYVIKSHPGETLQGLYARFGVIKRNQEEAIKRSVEKLEYEGRIYCGMIRGESPLLTNETVWDYRTFYAKKQP